MNSDADTVLPMETVLWAYHICALIVVFVFYQDSDIMTVTDIFAVRRKSDNQRGNLPDCLVWGIDVAIFCGKIIPVAQPIISHPVGKPQHSPSSL